MDSNPVQRILIIDDEPDIAAVIKRGLEKNSFATDAFTDPAKALQKIESQQYDLLLVDIRMPSMDGFTFYRKAKEFAVGKTKICFLTAIDSLDGETKGSDITKEIPPDCFFKKPISIDSLVSKVNTILSNP